jgi:hypothetical protein
MDVAATADGADRFMAYVEALTTRIGLCRCGIIAPDC